MTDLEDKLMRKYEEANDEIARLSINLIKAESKLGFTLTELQLAKDYIEVVLADNKKLESKLNIKEIHAR